MEKRKIKSLLGAWLFSVILLGIFSPLFGDLYFLNGGEFHRPYIEFQHFSRSLEGKWNEEEKVLAKAINQWQKALKWEGNFPMYWRELGRLQLIRARLKGTSRAWKKAEKSLKKVVHLKPAWGGGHYFLAWALFYQGEFLEADDHMIKAQILNPHDFKTAPAMAKYWMARLDMTKDKASGVFLRALQNRLHYLNQVKPRHWIPRTLSAWKRYSPSEKSWKTILPARDLAFWEASFYFWKKGEIVKAQKAIREFGTPDFQKRKKLLLAVLSLSRGKRDQAFEYLRDYEPEKEAKGVGEKEKLLLAEFIKKGHFTALMEEIKEKTWFDGPLCLYLFREAFEEKEFSSLARLFDWAQKRFSFPKGEFEYLYSRFLEKSDRNFQAAQLASQAVAKDLSRLDFRRHYYELLWRQKRFEKVERHLEENFGSLNRPAPLAQWLAEKYRSHGNYNQALRWAEKAMEGSSEIKFRQYYQNIFQEWTKRKLKNGTPK